MELVKGLEAVAVDSARVRLAAGSAIVAGGLAGVIVGVIFSSRIGAKITSLETTIATKADALIAAALKKI